jgi:hypothetical protein
MVLVSIGLCPLEDVCIVNQSWDIRLKIRSHATMQFVVPAVNGTCFLLCLFHVLLLHRCSFFFWYLLLWL